MWRNIHSWLGLVLALLVMALSMTGTILATKPIYNAYNTQTTGEDATVAEIIERIAKKNPRIAPQRLQIQPSGEVKLTYARNNRQRETHISLDDGKFIPARKEPKFYEFVRNFHRSFLLGEKGRWIAGAGGLVMSVLCLSGLFLLLRRLGGWRAFFGSISKRGVANQHAFIGRWTLLPLILTSLTALWLTAITLNLVPTGSEKPPAYPESLKELEQVNPWTLHGLQEIPIASVKEIIYPIPEDWFDVWTVKTSSEYIFIDQFTGDVLSRDALPMMAKVYDWVRFLHMGEGSVVWALVLFFSSLSVPFFAITGVIIWWKNKRNGAGKIKNNAKASVATTLIVVGSEGGSTWGFAKALQEGLRQVGEKTRLIEMNALKGNYPQLKRIIALTATYGHGDPPKSATRFLMRWEKNNNREIEYATLAFGDKAFPQYCAFGEVVEKAFAEKCLKGALLPLTKVDKQSAQTFDHWCANLAKVLNLPLEVRYQPKRPRTYTLTLAEKSLYGEQVGTTIAILRFQAEKLPKYQSGDLVAIYPPECAIPRLYSIGSNAREEGFLEICVRLQEGGLCSTWLCGLEVGEHIEVTIEVNERFHLPRKKPVVMIGAGTGIAPFVGMIRQNLTSRPFDLYWGGRHPEADALYEQEIIEWLQTQRLHHYSPAWSRVEKREYVQDKIRADREHLLQRLKDGATIMVCGGAAMAAAVQEEIESLAAELGTSVIELKRHNRYLEDVY